LPSRAPAACLTPACSCAAQGSAPGSEGKEHDGKEPEGKDAGGTLRVDDSGAVTPTKLPCALGQLKRWGMAEGPMSGLSVDLRLVENEDGSPRLLGEGAYGQARASLPMPAPRARPRAIRSARPGARRMRSLCTAFMCRSCGGRCCSAS